MTVVIYAEGTVIGTGKGEVRIYVRKPFRDRLTPLIGREVRMIILVDENESP